MDLIAIRRVIVTALASDDFLVEELVLKGGNALELAYAIGNRASVDLDYSMRTEFADVDDAGARILRGLADRFDSVGIVVFDFSFGPRPASAKHGTRWGGYRAEFKLSQRDVYAKYEGDLMRQRSTSVAIEPSGGRIFKIDISRYEVVDSSNEIEIDNYPVLVCTPTLIAIEKLRAICQQMKEYPQRAHPAPRARDFYDIHAIATGQAIEFTTNANIELLKNVFAVKEVPLVFIGHISAYREFHRTSWPAVTNAVRISIESFDFYFDYVVALAAVLLERSREVETPV